MMWKQLLAIVISITPAYSKYMTYSFYLKSEVTETSTVIAKLAFK